ncbi:MAG: hypothetical protein ABIH78_05110 [Candidatus Peregrinibacteria bacterium]
MFSGPEKSGGIREILEKSLLAGNLFKAGFFFLIGAALIFGNIFFESTFVSGGEAEKAVLTLDYSAENIIPDRGILRFENKAVSGIENSVSLRETQGDESEYVFDVASAKFWGNFRISNAKVNFVTDKIVVIPDHAVFSLEADDKKVTLSVLDGNVYIGLLDDGISLDDYADQYSKVFVNKLLVPRDTRVTIPFGKLDDRIKSLLYSKLVKEFKYSAVPASEKESDWVSGNLGKDNKYVDSVKQETVSNIIFKGESVSDTLFGNFVFWAEENLTFIPSKKNDALLDHLFAYLDDAAFYANEGDKVESSVSFDEFKDYLSSLSQETSTGEEMRAKLADKVDELSVFGPGDSVYPVFLELMDMQFKNGGDRYGVVDRFWLDVYSGIDLGESEAMDALDTYYSYFDSTLGKYDDFEFYKEYIVYNNQLFDNLLLRYSYFYKDAYFAMKNVIEREMSKLYEAGQLKDELSQEFISNKISFLKRMRGFFFGEEITVAEAKSILARLVNEIDDLMPAEDSGVAVIELFQAQLEDIGDFWGYLNSPEYHISKTYGNTQKERYESYLADKDRIWSIVNIQEDILGDNVGEFTLDDAKREILSVFAQNSDVSDVELEDLTDPSQRRVKVKGVIGGYSFEAVYDRDKDNLTDVYSYGNIVSDRPLNLDNLLDLLKGKFADLETPVDEEGEPLTEETIAERRARLYVVQVVSDAGFAIEMDNVSIIDSANSVYRVREVTIPGHDDVLVTFDYMILRGERATNIYLSVKGKPVVLNDELTLAELKDVITAEGDFGAAGNKEGSSGGVLR